MFRIPSQSALRCESRKQPSFHVLHSDTKSRTRFATLDGKFPIPSGIEPSPWFHKRGSEFRGSVSSYAIMTTSETKSPSTLESQTEYDAVVIGAGMGGLTVASQLASKGQSVLLLEKYVIPGGSAGYYRREGYTFDVGSSMMFGFGKQGTTNLITKVLESVGKELETIPDPVQIHYHLPSSRKRKNGLDIKVWRKYEEFLDELILKFPHEEQGIRRFYQECWTVFNSLNVLELKSLEEPKYLLEQFSKHPIACLQLAARVFTNTGDVAKRFISDEELLRVIDMECFCWSTVSADNTPLINAGMVFCDRHFGGINYPKGGVGRIATTLADGFEEHGGKIMYKANVKRILTKQFPNGQTEATGVELSNGTIYKAKVVISNATRWDTFEKMIDDENLPESEIRFRQRYKKAPSFLTIHLGIRKDVLPPNCYCHHIVLEDWSKMEDARGTIFVSIPTLLDPSLAPEGHHIFHTFTPDWVDNWKGLSPSEYRAKKTKVANEVIARLETIFPGLTDAIEFKEVGTPKTHRRFLGREDGTYGPIPSRRPSGMMTMPFNKTSVKRLYCVGDSTFPGQGVNAVVFSGFGCAHRVLCDLGVQPTIPIVDEWFASLLQMIREET